MSKYEVTQAEYKEVMQNQEVTIGRKEYTLAAEPSYCKKTNKTEYGKRPVENVTWYDAVYYCNARSEKEGLTKAYDITGMTVKNNHLTDANVKLVDNANGYRLPTEAEWEYAARGGDPTAEDWNYTFSGATTKDQNYKSGDLESDSALDAVGWYSYNNDTGTTNTSYVINDAKRKGTHEAGKKAANRLGIYDMSGNVWEWCYDWDTNSVDATDVYYSYRGGCWYDIANFCTVSDQRYFTPDNRDFNLGFREVRSAK